MRELKRQLVAAKRAALAEASPNVTTRAAAAAAPPRAKPADAPASPPQQLAAARKRMHDDAARRVAERAAEQKSWPSVLILIRVLHRGRHQHSNAAKVSRNGVRAGRDCPRRPPAGYSAGESRGGAAAASWIFRRERSRRRLRLPRGCSEGPPSRRYEATLAEAACWAPEGATVAELEKASQDAGGGVDAETGGGGAFVLVNLNEDPQLSGALRYALKPGASVVGAGDADVRLGGTGVASRHAAFRVSADAVAVAPLDGEVFLNGTKVFSGAGAASSEKTPSERPPKSRRETVSTTATVRDAAAATPPPGRRRRDAAVATPPSPRRRRDADP